MIRAWLAVAAVTGSLSVAAGAIAAHFTSGAMAAHLAAGDRTAELLRTGAPPGITLVIAGWSFAAGTLLFSLSLFTLALTGIAALGWITPFGGAGLLIGWAALGLHALQRPH